jgi:hypothetical protein
LVTGLSTGGSAYAAVIPITIAMAATGRQDFLIGYLLGVASQVSDIFGRKPSGSEEALPAWERAARRWCGWP